MCGIAGLLSARRRVARLAEDELRRMMARLHHRGPDGQGVLVEGPGPHRPGARRLAIIDLAGGAQPMANEDDRVWVVFNGEIFNYVELRAELLARGHLFRTASDTEVIVHALRGAGRRLRRRASTASSRSRSGTAAAGACCWRATASASGRCSMTRTQGASGLRLRGEGAVRAAGRAAPRSTRPALAEIFTFWSALPPAHACSRACRACRRATCMACRTTARRRQFARYWDWQFPTERRRRRRRASRTTRDELRALLIDAVRLQLRADVPVGAYLCGGLDSSIIAALDPHAAPARRCAPSRSPSRTPSSTRRELPAGAWWRSWAPSTRDRAAAAADIAAAFPRSGLARRDAVVRTAPAPLMLLSGLRARRSGFKVVLTGEGADEVFGGYDLFKEARDPPLHGARSRARRWRGALLERLYPYLAHSPAARPRHDAALLRRGAGPGRTSPGFAHIAALVDHAARAAVLLHPDCAHALDAWDPAPALAADAAARTSALAARWRATSTSRPTR